MKALRSEIIKIKEKINRKISKSWINLVIINKKQTNLLMKSFIATATLALSVAAQGDLVQEADHLTAIENYDTDVTKKITEDGYECERMMAVGHDGHYDEHNVWILDADYDAEPEWRCLMRPLLREATV